MYNHYTPQSDGSYQRSSRPDAARRPPAPQANLSGNPPPAAFPGGPQTAPERPRSDCREGNSFHPAPPEPGLFSCLRELLPGRMDMADLAVVLLILLMDRERCEEDCAPLLTLALYFLM